MGIPRLLGVCSALLFASSVNAANIIDLGPSDYRNYGGGSASHTSGGVRSSFGQTVRMPPTLNTLNVTRNAVIPYGSIANGLRNFTRITPGSIAASAAVTGLFLAVDWVFDQEMGEWVKIEEGVLEDPEFGLWAGGNPQLSGPSPDVVCQDIGYSQLGWGGNIQFHGTQITSSTNAICQIAIGGGISNSFSITRVAECPEGFTYNSTSGTCSSGAFPVPLTGADWAELQSTLPSLPAGQIREAAGDVQRQLGNPLPGYTDTTITGPSSVSGPETTSTSTDPVTGDTVVTTTNTTTNISYGDQTITTTNTTTTTTHQNGQETSTTVTTETPGELPVSSGGGAAGDWPGFCDWATVVCDWLDWTQEDPPPEQDLPAVIDDDFYQEKSISFGAKSCPPDHEINLAPFMPTAVAVSFQPLCDFAGLIYYMVMAASYIIAAYITIGVARNG